MTTHTCIRILYCSVYPQLPPVIGAPRGCCGHASGIFSPRTLWFGGCAIHATPCSVPGYSYLRTCLKKSERNRLTSYLYNSEFRKVFHFAQMFCPDVLLRCFIFICIEDPVRTSDTFGGGSNMTWLCPAR